MTFLPRAAAPLALGLLAACASNAAPFISIPNPTPSPTPSVPALAVSPSTVTVNGLGAAFAQTIKVSENNYSGGFAESDTCSSIATVQSSLATGPSAMFVATGVAVGTCSATFVDATLQKATVLITVSVSNVVINKKNHGERHHG